MKIKSFDELIVSFNVKKPVRMVEFILLLVLSIVEIGTIIVMKPALDAAGFFNVYSSFFALLSTAIIFVYSIEAVGGESSSKNWFVSLAGAFGLKNYCSALCAFAIKVAKDNYILCVIFATLYLIATFATFFYFVCYIRVIARPRNSSGLTFLIVYGIASILCLGLFVYSAASGLLFKTGSWRLIFSFIPGDDIPCTILTIIAMGFSISYVYNSSRTEIKTGYKAYIAYFVLMAFLYVIQVPIRGLHISSLMDYFVICFFYNDDAVKQSRTLVDKEKVVSSQRIDIMRSQIQPHFIFNALNTICFLCRKDPELAEKATKNFASYLRMNINSIGNSSMVPFNKELEHVKTYVELEKLRFSDKIEVVFDTEYVDFNIPPLALQPIVENAIKHGFGKNKTSLLIRISSKLEGNTIVVKVIDNGVGFDINTVDFGDGTHIGIQNVKNRMVEIAGGSLEIYSLVGTGTMATFKLPVETILTEGGN